MCVFGYLRHPMCPLAVGDFVSQGVSELVVLAPAVNGCLLECTVAMWGCAGMDCVSLCLGVCPNASVVECAFVSVA